MLKINYKLNARVVDLKTELTTPVDNTKADFYLDKQQGWLKLKVDVNPNINSTPIIYDVKRYKSSTKIQTNTTAIDLTDIVFKDKPYFYKLVYKTNKPLELSKLKVKLSLEELIEYNGNLYTNTEVCLYHNTNEYYYTEKVRPKIYEVTYRSKYIEINTSPNIHYKLPEAIISPSIINAYMMYIPSFYLETDKHLYRCIDSNPQTFESKAECSPGNYLRYMLETSTEAASRDFNAYFQDDPDVVLTFRHSSHCLPLLKSIEYFKILNDNSIVEASKDDYVFKVIKEVDTSKIVITPNNYKTNYSVKNNLLGSVVNSIYEEDEELNDFSLTYRTIDKIRPTYNYISKNGVNISFNSTGTTYKGTIKEMSLIEDGFKVEAVGGVMNNTNMNNTVSVDNINYEVL